MLENRNPNAKKGCSISTTGKCKDCPHWRCMPVDVTDPTTGKLLKTGTVWDCIFAWQMLGSWDAGRQAQGIHAAVNQMSNRTDQRQQQLLHLVSNGAPPPQLPDESGG